MNGLKLEADFCGGMLFLPGEHRFHHILKMHTHKKNAKNSQLPPKAEELLFYTVFPGFEGQVLIDRPYSAWLLKVYLKIKWQKKKIKWQDSSYPLEEGCMGSYWGGHQRDFWGTDYIMDLDAGYRSVSYVKTHQAEHTIFFFFFLPLWRCISLRG